MKYSNIVITGTGCYIPTEVVTNHDFAENKFYDTNGDPFDIDHEEIAEKFKAITGINERRYVTDDLQASDIGTFASITAIDDAGIDREDLDYIICANNFGDVKKGTIQSDFLPSLASRIKQGLGIKNPNCVVFDVVFGCPGWLQGIIMAESFIRSGQAKKCLVVATETLSRVLDLHDRDSMIYSDGAGACIVESRESDIQEGILSTTAASYTDEEAYYLYLGKANIHGADEKVRYLKMHGRKIYEFALKHVPPAMKACLDKANLDYQDVKKIFIHQANEKLDVEVTKRFYRQYKVRQVPDMIMPMNIHFMGNSSVATIPTLFDRIRKNQCRVKHDVNKGDLLLFASVGAGMNINAIAYKY